VLDDSSATVHSHNVDVQSRLREAARAALELLEAQQSLLHSLPRHATLVVAHEPGSCRRTRVTRVEQRLATQIRLLRRLLSESASFGCSDTVEDLIRTLTARASLTPYANAIAEVVNEIAQLEDAIDLHYALVRRWFDPRTILTVHLADTIGRFRSARHCAASNDNARALARLLVRSPMAPPDLAFAARSIGGVSA
jgi:hypothetical protein